jgi:hypothetical protein
LPQVAKTCSCGVLDLLYVFFGFAFGFGSGFAFGFAFDSDTTPVLFKGNFRLPMTFLFFFSCTRKIQFFWINIYIIFDYC